MNLFEDIIVTKIEHVIIANFKSHEISDMKLRPWYGIAFALGGEVTYTHNSEKISLFGNRVVLLPRHSTYEIECTKSGSFAVINFLTERDLDICNFVITETNDISSFQREFSLMHKLFLSNSPQDRYKNLSSLYKIFSMLINSFDEKRFPNILHNALKYIDNNLHSPELCNTQIAEALGISEVYLRKLFSNNMSVNVKQYIRNKRIDTARTLLTETTLPITEISEKCGYSCIYYFCNSFKHQTGYTPSEYRNNNPHGFF